MKQNCETEMCLDPSKSKMVFLSFGWTNRLLGPFYRLPALPSLCSWHWSKVNGITPALRLSILKTASHRRVCPRSSLIQHPLHLTNHPYPCSHGPAQWQTHSSCSINVLNKSNAFTICQCNKTLPHDSEIPLFLKQFWVRRERISVICVIGIFMILLVYCRQSYIDF